LIVIAGSAGLRSVPVHHFFVDLIVGLSSLSGVDGG
jgi:hypothetical protein